MLFNICKGASLFPIPAIVTFFFLILCLYWLWLPFWATFLQILSKKLLKANHNQRPGDGSNLNVVVNIVKETFESKSQHPGKGQWSCDNNCHRPCYRSWYFFCSGKTFKADTDSAEVTVQVKVAVKVAVTVAFSYDHWLHGLHSCHRFRWCFCSGTVQGCCCCSWSC